MLYMGVCLHVQNNLFLSVFLSEYFGFFILHIYIHIRVGGWINELIQNKLYAAMHTCDHENLVEFV